MRLVVPTAVPLRLPLLLSLGRLVLVVDGCKLLGAFDLVFQAVGLGGDVAGGGLGLADLAGLVGGGLCWAWRWAGGSGRGG